MAQYGAQFRLQRLQVAADGGPLHPKAVFGSGQTARFGNGPEYPQEAEVTLGNRRDGGAGGYHGVKYTSIGAEIPLLPQAADDRVVRTGIVLIADPTGKVEAQSVNQAAKVIRYAHYPPTFGLPRGCGRHGAYFAINRQGRDHAGTHPQGGERDRGDGGRVPPVRVRAGWEDRRVWEGSSDRGDCRAGCQTRAIGRALAGRAAGSFAGKFDFVATTVASTRNGPSVMPTPCRLPRACPIC